MCGCSQTRVCGSPRPDLHQPATTEVPGCAQAELPSRVSRQVPKKVCQHGHSGVAPAGSSDTFLLGLDHILASLIRVLLACAGNGRPDLVIAIALPMVLTVILVLGGALSLCVGLILCLVLLHAHALVHSLALLFIDRAALLPGGGLAQSLCLSPAHLLILSCANERREAANVFRGVFIDQGNC